MCVCVQSCFRQVGDDWTVLQQQFHLLHNRIILSGTYCSTVVLEHVLYTKFSFPSFLFSYCYFPYCFRYVVNFVLYNILMPQYFNSQQNGSSTYLLGISINKIKGVFCYGWKQCVRTEVDMLPLVYLLCRYCMVRLVHLCPLLTYRRMLLRLFKGIEDEAPKTQYSQRLSAAPRILGQGGFDLVERCSL